MGVFYLQAILVMTFLFILSIVFYSLEDHQKRKEVLEKGAESLEKKEAESLSVIEKPSEPVKVIIDQPVVSEKPEELEVVTVKEIVEEIVEKKSFSEILLELRNELYWGLPESLIEKWYLNRKLWRLNEELRECDKQMFYEFVANSLGVVAYGRVEPYFAMSKVGSNSAHFIDESTILAKPVE